LDLQNFLPYQLSVLSNKISQGIASYYHQQHGITISEWRVLALLSETSDITAKELAELSQMDKVKISRTMKVLEGKGLISEKTCLADARARRYRLTRDGEKLINQVKPKAIEFENKLITGLSTKDLKLFKNCIHALNMQVENILREK